MSDCVCIAGLVHEVINHHFISVRDHAPEVKVYIMCGGYTIVPCEYDWRCDDVVTCFWCVVCSNVWSIQTVKVVVEI